MIGTGGHRIDRGAARVPRRAGRRIAWVAALLVVAGIDAGRADAQELPIRKLTTPAECPAVPIAQDLPVAAPGATDSLLAAGSRAAILGDQERARELLQRAVELDPLNPVASYRLARTLDDAGETEAAIHEYCRYLALAADADSAAVGERIRALSEASPVTPTTPWEVAFVDGVTAYEAGQFRESVQAFSRSIELRPEWAEAYYNRALAYLEDGRGEFAVYDFQKYLELAPAAPDGPLVAARLQELQPLAAQTLSRWEATARPTGAAPLSALFQGLIIPGLGQVATGRTVLGLFVAAATGGAAYLSTHEKTVVETRTATGPFGNEYEYEVRSVRKPYQTHGIITAAAIALGAAVESYVYAERRREAFMAVPRVAAETDSGPRLNLSPSPDGGLNLAVRFTVR